VFDIYGNIFHSKIPGTFFNFILQYWQACEAEVFGPGLGGFSCINHADCPSGTCDFTVQRCTMPSETLFFQVFFFFFLIFSLKVRILVQCLMGERNYTGIRNSVQVNLLAKLGLPSTPAGQRGALLAEYYRTSPLCLPNRETDPDMLLRTYWAYTSLLDNLGNCPACTNKYFTLGSGSTWPGPYNPPILGNRPDFLVDKHPQSQGFGQLMEIQDWCTTVLTCPVFFEHTVAAPSLKKCLHNINTNHPLEQFITPAINTPSDCAAIAPSGAGDCNRAIDCPVDNCSTTCLTTSGPPAFCGFCTNGRCQSISMEILFAKHSSLVFSLS